MTLATALPIPPGMDRTEFATRLKDRATAVERVLEAALVTRVGWPERLADAMRYAVLGGGKRLRPFVLIEAAQIFGAEGSGVLHAGAALELIHAYSLVHDDLPAMDDDDLRRGRPTLHRAYDEATAILVGDALQSHAFDVIADPATDPDPAIRAELVAKLARAAGIGGMAGGQALDLAGEGKALSEAEIIRLQVMKTGALFRYAAEAGAVIGRAEAGELARLAEFGSALGAAFQLADDLLDHTGNTEELGKVTGRDAALAKPTLVALLGEARAREMLAAHIDAAEAALAPFGERAATLLDSVRFVAERG